MIYQDRRSPGRCGYCGHEGDGSEFRETKCIYQTQHPVTRKRTVAEGKFTVCKDPKPCAGHLQMSMEG